MSKKYFTGLCSAHRDGEDRNCKICWSDKSFLSRLKIEISEYRKAIGRRLDFIDDE